MPVSCKIIAFGEILKRVISTQLYITNWGKGMTNRDDTSYKYNICYMFACMSCPSFWHHTILFFNGRETPYSPVYWVWDTQHSFQYVQANLACTWEKVQDKMTLHRPWLVGLCECPTLHRVFFCGLAKKNIWHLAVGIFWLENAVK